MINIIPKPLSVVEGSGTITLSKASVISGDFKITQKYIKNFLKACETPTDSQIVFLCVDSIAEEGYEIVAKDNIVKISASTEKGAFYAIQTIIQLLCDGEIIPCVEISDKPHYSWRGFMLDSARHFWTIEHIKMLLDIMAELKMNIFHWHLTDDQGWRIEIKKYPELTAHGSIRKATQLAVLNGGIEDKEYGRGLFYTQEQISEIVKYASTKNINVVPEIDMPGHLVAVLSCFPELSCEGAPIDVSPKWGVLDTIGCCGNDKFYEFVKDILDEVCALFPYDYFHIGGDEVPKTKWKKCPKCQAKMKELGLKDENELQGYFNNYVLQYVKTKGKNLIGWNEVLDASSLDKDVIIQWWTPYHGKQLVKNWIASGGKVILTKHNNVYMDHSYAVRPLIKTYEFKASDLGVKDSSNIVGMEAPQWTEYIRTEEKFNFNTFPRMMAIAEAAWTPAFERNYQSFVTRLENLRPHFEGKFKIKMADKFTYEGKQVKGLFRNKKAWVKWSLNPNHELENSNR